MYCNDVDIRNELPSAYPEQIKTLVDAINPDANEQDYIDAWVLQVQAFILHYAGYIDVMVGSQYAYIDSYKFPAWNAGTPTPAIITEICHLLTLSKCLSWYNTAASDEEDPDITTNKDRADKLLEQIRKGELLITTAGITPGGYNLTTVERVNQMTDEGFAGFVK